MNNDRTPGKTRPQASGFKPVPPKGGRRPRPPAEPAWTEVANFILNFESRTVDGAARENRITAHKMQDGGQTATWVGTGHQPMFQWIRDHLDDWPEPVSETLTAFSTTPSAQTTMEATALPTGRRATLTVPPAGKALPAYRLQVAALHPISGRAPGQTVGERTAAATDSGAPVHLLGAASFGLEATVFVDAVNADDIALGSAQCAVEFFCRNTQTAEKSRLGPAVTLDVAGTQRSYTAVLPSVTLLPGSYRVACVARLHNAIAPVACMQGPLLQVEALG